jgi:phosphoglycerate dehydrogenase-like enzyme
MAEDGGATGAQESRQTGLTVLITWDLGQDYVEQIRRAVPGVRILQETNPEAALRLAPEAEVIFAEDPPREMVQAAKRVRWLQAVSAGVESWLYPEVRGSDIVLTNSSGIHGTPIAELIISMALCFATGLAHMIAAQRLPDHGHPPEGNAVHPPREDVRSAVRRQKFELEGQTMGIVGLGSIGDATARKAHGLGMRVLATRRHPGERPPYVERLLGADRDGLSVILRESDHVALCLPLTPETDSLIGEAELRQMKSTAYIYNVGRGASINQQALDRALLDGVIAGAGLDVSVPDPPDDDSPLWFLPNVILSQHTSGYSPTNDRHLTDLFIDNLRRYLAGTSLINQVNKSLGY